MLTVSCGREVRGKAISRSSCPLHKRGLWRWSECTGEPEARAQLGHGGFCCLVDSRAEASGEAGHRDPQPRTGGELECGPCVFTVMRQVNSPMQSTEREAAIVDSLCQFKKVSEEKLNSIGSAIPQPRVAPHLDSIKGK